MSIERTGRLDKNRSGITGTEAAPEQTEVTQTDRGSTTQTEAAPSRQK